ncbi:MAG: diaminopimelate decarboxylase [Candidatus Heimdallarchaeota archaeon]|nr:diaminopimelate decarboxylase [Candidatus Heimdallarchaeota archaeon]
MNWLLANHLENQDGELFIDGLSTMSLVRKYGSPLYVLSESRIRKQYQLLHNALIENYPLSRIFYSVKANSNLSVLKILKKEGSYLDVVSPGEVFLALEAGFSADKMLYTGTSVTNQELDYLLEKNIAINIDSKSLLDRLIDYNVPSLVSFRVNPLIGVGHHKKVVTAGKSAKFGITESGIVDVYRSAQKIGVEKFGMQMHIGTGSLQVEPFAEALFKLLDIASLVHKETGIQFEFIDIGGGIGVPYKPGEETVNVQQYASTLLSIFKERIKDDNLGSPYFYVEPGRFIVADAGLLLAEVNTIKKTPFKQFVGIDAGFNTLVRPTMYGSYHHVLVANKLNAEETQEYDIVGPICETGDILAENRTLPDISEGDLLAITNAGAYGFSMSSTYNSRPRAAEVLVNNGKSEIIRERESFSDLLLNQKIAGWL